MPRASNPTKASGTPVDTVARVTRDRAPTTADLRRPSNNVNYELQTLWIDTSTNQPWILVNKENNLATWVRFAGDAGDVISLTGDDSVLIEPDSAGNIDILGVIVPRGTNIKPLYVDGDATSTKLDIELQLATATAKPADSNDAGICSFISDHFDVDANGSVDIELSVDSATPDASGLAGICYFNDAQFVVNDFSWVSLVGGATPATQKVNVDFNTAPGVDPVVNDATGQINIHGSTVARRTNANYPVATHSRNVNTFEIEVQVASDITGAPATMYDAGLSSYDDTVFIVDDNGYVTLVGGAGPVTLSISGDEGSGNVPDGTGDIGITGDVVINGTHGKPVYIDDTAASASTIDVQVGTALASAPSDKLDAGLVSFDSADFAVSTNGHVTFLGGGSSSTVHIVEDFMNRGGGGAAGYYQFPAQGTPNLAVASGAGEEAGHPGVLKCSGNAGNGMFICSDDVSAANTFCYRLGSGEIAYRTWFKADTFAAGAEAYALGFHTDVLGGGLGAANVRFYAVQGTANIRAQNYDGTQTDTDTGISVDNAWHFYEIIVNDDATSITFKIDGSTVATNTTNIPSGGIAVGNLAINAVATRFFYTDFIECIYTPTGVRA